MELVLSVLVVLFVLSVGVAAASLVLIATKGASPSQASTKTVAAAVEAEIERLREGVDTYAEIVTALAFIRDPELSVADLIKRLKDCSDEALAAAFQSRVSSLGRQHAAALKYLEAARHRQNTSSVWDSEVERLMNIVQDLTNQLQAARDAAHAFSATKE